MGSDVTVITPTLPERAGMLNLMLADWAAQTVQPAEVKVGVDYYRQGPAVLRNRLVESVATEWLAFADDDDRFDTDHLETLVAASGGADVVWSLCRVTGESQGWEPAHRCPPSRGEIP